MSKMEQVLDRINLFQKALAEAQAEYAELRLEELKKVTVTRNDASTTLAFNGRVINAKKNRYGRYRVTEQKKTLVSEYFGSIHDLRFDVAQGRI